MDYEFYFRNIRKEVAEHDAALAERRQRALAFASQMAQLLKQRFGVREVKLVGSMSDPGVKIGRNSDIDLLVEGLPEEEYIHALTAVESLASGEFAVDLIRLEEVNEKAKKQFFAKGLTL